jgi:hypothetical protein
MGILYYQLFLSGIGHFTDSCDRYWSTAAIDSMTQQSGASDSVRQYFLDYGDLPNTHDSNYRAINDKYPVFAFGG